MPAKTVRKRYLFHAASPENRMSILKSGLKKGSYASFGPPAIYFFKHDIIAENYLNDPMDVWKVDVSGYTIYKDPEDPMEACYSLISIPKERLTLTGTFLEGELINGYWNADECEFIVKQQRRVKKK